MITDPSAIPATDPALSNGQKDTAPVEVSAASPCKDLRGNAGCQVAANGVVACRNWTDGREVTTGKRDGQPYYVYRKDEIKTKRYERLVAETQRALSVLVAPDSVVELRR